MVEAPRATKRHRRARFDPGQLRGIKSVESGRKPLGGTIERDAMIPELPHSMPDRHRSFLLSTIDRLQHDSRIVGIAAGGSFLSDSMDEFSDLDLVIGVEPNHYESVMADRHRIAGSLGELLAAFTGEHVGEARCLICLYGGSPILHVDLKFLALPDVAQRVEDPSVLWEREGRFTKAIKEGIAQYPIPNLQWIEDRFWVWIHYATAKIGRGELFEALDGLSFLRTTVLGPLALLRSGARPAGVRKLERLAPTYVPDLESTVAGHDAFECLRALRASVELYRSLRVNTVAVAYSQAAERATMQYLSEVEQQFGLTRG
jgi:hypothetical protein